MISRMNRSYLLCLFLPAILLFCVTISTSAADSTKASDQPAPTHSQPLLTSHQQKPADTLPSEYFVLEISHRIYQDFHEVDTVAMNQKFPIGEGDEEGMVILFNPHLGLTDSFKVVQVSDSLINPAVRVQVTQKDSVIQESWAFSRGSAPHFRRNDMLGFRLIDYRVGDKYIRPVQAQPATVPKSADSTGPKK